MTTSTIVHILHLGGTCGVIAIIIETGDGHQRSNLIQGNLCFTLCEYPWESNGNKGVTVHPQSSRTESLIT